ncbi:MAG: beta-lactamase family protein [Sulfurovum sp.]|nr:beta-lactamase family protein [Sulfurovum sp.]
MKLKCKTIKKIPLIASLAFLVGCTSTPEPKLFHSEADKYAYVKEYMRWYIKEQMNDKDLVGLSVALVDDQKIVWSEGFGYADKEKGIKATPQTRYRAGSITKLFTDMAVMKLVEEGKMDIDKPFKTYLPEFSIKSRFGSTDNITPRNIMTHHSGLPSEWLDKMFSENPLPYTEHVNVIHDEYVATKPNTVFSYSNLGLTLLGHSVEKVSGIKYADVVKQTLFMPLDMKHSDLKMALSGENASKSYSKGKETKELSIGEVPAGALNTSVEDLAHLAMMINANGTYKNHQVLKASTLKKMFTVQNANVPLDVGFEIGLGYFIDNKLLGKKDTVYSHGGNTIAQNAYFCVSPHSKLGVVAMSNNAGIDARDIAKKLLQKTWEAKTAKKVKKEKHSVTHASDFSGVYATVVGRATFTKNSNNDYTAYTDDGTFKLYKTKDNLYKLKYKLLGLLPISKDELDEVELYTDEIEGHHVIIAFWKGNKFIAGVKVEKPKYIPDAWKKYVGHYKVLNNFEVEKQKIKDVEFKIENGYALIKPTRENGNKSTFIVRPVNDTEAIIEGLGRSMQETIYMKDGVFHARGLQFKKIEGKTNNK